MGDLTHVVSQFTLNTRLVYIKYFPKWPEVQHIHVLDVQPFLSSDEQNFTTVFLLARITC